MMENSKQINEISIMKRCPYCNWRIIDKLTPATGIIRVKCPKCRRQVNVDLSLRAIVHFRRAA